MKTTHLVLGVLATGVVGYLLLKKDAPLGHSTTPSAPTRLAVSSAKIAPDGATMLTSGMTYIVDANQSAAGRWHGSIVGPLDAGAPVSFGDDAILYRV